MKKVKLFSVVIIVVILISGKLSYGLPNESDSQVLEYIISGMRNNMSLVYDSQLEYLFIKSRTQESMLFWYEELKETTPTKIFGELYKDKEVFLRRYEKEIYNVKYYQYLDNLKYIVSKTMADGTPRENRTEVILSDGGQFVTLTVFPSEKYGDGIIYPVEARALSTYEPLMFNNKLGHSYTWGWLEKNKDNTTQVDKQNTVYVVTVTEPTGLIRVLFIDESKGFSVVKVETKDGAGNIQTIKRSEISLVGNIWYPSSAQMDFYKKSKDGITFVSETWTIEIVPGSMQLNKGLALQDIKITFPPGTLVKDNIKNIEFWIPDFDDYKYLLSNIPGL